MKWQKYEQNEFFKAHQQSFPWTAWQWTHCHLSTLGVDHAFLSAKHGLEVTYKSFSDNGEKIHFQYLKHQCTYDAMTRGRQETNHLYSFA